VTGWHTTNEGLPVSIAPGTVIAGKFRIERVLGRGGMAVVVAARHVQLDMNVAIKFLLPELGAQPEAMVRFAREAQASVKITSEHVARVFDVGALDERTPFIVMEFLDGRDLAAWLRSDGPLPVEQAVEFVLHACDALAEAHLQGIIHRDLKPSNLFCVRKADGQLAVKVLDFGISKLGDTGRGAEPAPSVTRTAASMGTPFYMSPEQMESAKLTDARTDIWALGVILYELLTGRVPFGGVTITEIAVKVATHRPAPLRDLRPDVAPELESIVLRCLEKDRERRPGSIGKLALALAPFAPPRAKPLVERITSIGQASTTGGESRPASSLPRVPSVAPESDGPASREWRPPGRRSARSMIVAGVVGVSLGCALVLSHAATWRAARPDPTLSGGARAPAFGATPAPNQIAPGPRVSVTATAAPPSRVEDPGRLPEFPGAPPADTAARDASSHGGTAEPLVTRPQPRRLGPAAAPSSAVDAAARPTLAAACDPPYTLDGQFRKHFKPECFINK
jgi:serine/threonine protein kinase